MLPQTRGKRIFSFLRAAESISSCGELREMQCRMEKSPWSWDFSIIIDKRHARARFGYSTVRGIDPTTRRYAKVYIYYFLSFSLSVIL